MPTNTHALIRYRTIDKCLRSAAVYHLHDLIEACSDAVSAYTGKPAKVSRRTLMYDLRFMKDDNDGFNAPIAYDYTDGYYYTISGYSVFNITISKRDIDVLKDVLGTLRSISGNEQFKGMDNVISRLEETYNISRSRSEKPAILYQHSLNEAGQKWVGFIYQRIKEKKALKIDYQPFGKEMMTFNLSPYLLKEYNNRWFAIGYHHHHEALSTIALDRIKEIVESVKPFYEDPTFDPLTWDRDIIGVSINQGKPKETIELRTYGKLRDYLRTKPVHHSQKYHGTTGDKAGFSLEIIPNYELESVLLSFGDELEVVSPEWLRTKLAARLKTLLERYQ